MTDEMAQFYKLLRIRLDGATRQELNNFNLERSQYIRMAASKGNLNNVRTFLIVTEALKKSIDTSKKNILVILEETYAAFVPFIIDSSNDEEIKLFCSSVFDEQKNYFVSEMLNSTPYTGSGFLKDDQKKKITEDQLSEIDDYYKNIKSQLEAEIEIFTRKSKMSNQKSDSGTTVNVTGNVGFIQTGDYSSAVINDSHKDSIYSSFQLIRSHQDLIDPAKFHEIEPLMAECEEELKKQTPNKSKVGGLLGAVGSAISGIGKLGSAYQAIKTFSPIIGGPILP